MKRLAAPREGWLAFELNVLCRLKFSTAILPFAGEPQLGAYLKRWNARVAANDLTQAGFVKAVASIENNDQTLSEAEVALVLENAYVPHRILQNRALKKWFNEIDARWFDNVRAGAEKLSSHVKQAIALSVGIEVGSYVFSFTDETRPLRQPLSKVYERLLKLLPLPIDNGQKNFCQNKTANEFIAQNSASDLMFLRLPQPADKFGARKTESQTAWREEWINGDDAFWTDFEREQAGKLGAFTESKAQYLRFLEDVLQTAAPVSKWAIAHVENGFVSTQDIAETIGRVRRVDTIFTKDFTDLTGAKAVIITA